MSLNIEKQFAGDLVADIGWAREKKTKFAAERSHAPLKEAPPTPFLSLQAWVRTPTFRTEINALLAKLENGSSGLSFLAPTPG
jgi:hypothetical protein